MVPGGPDEINTIEDQGPDVVPEMSEAEKRRARRRLFWRTFRSTVYGMVSVITGAALAVVLLCPIIRASGSNMAPALEHNDVVLLMRTDSPKRNDIICFRWEGRNLVKRVIAGPGDTVDIQKDGTVYVNGEFVTESYVTLRQLGDSDIDYPFAVPEGSWFVLTDHRDVMTDSRSAIIGCVTAEQITGKAFLCIWPINRISRVK